MLPFFFATSSFMSLYRIAPCQYLPLHYLCPLIFGLTPLACCAIMLTPLYPIIYYGNIIFDLCPIFQEHN
jgi:hypothetical protein